ncbi:Ppx/GppA family phosphatase [Loigolactobacillus backii]|uniref:Exopolyphosphatase n=1 Tax=Loigolactobacillus backii TaxID=375175 RepID=A0A192GZY0_9LACO|nr:Ppx/GppA family phosphatase [Loigolactobacillus backii]ANK58785.1 exopolyphosphatase [Loigolactobacillus backii]ANK61552.1 exopolyphosphatase [Loigolactobacillus backii]ANK63776.1 exopolyphosphatase [Loigolactobacillus backii]ANK66224.1 exopolyphosphatase [Loigolactobacillus backii]ANK69250.1 exopolyphosphatase [Loigolactobacillus backii]
MENFAVIDLGSNSARLTISEIEDDGTYKVIKQLKEMVRLSEDMGADQNLQQPAIERTITALKKFRDEYSKLPNLKVRAIATAATRMAKNQKKFLKQVADEVAGLQLEVIPGTLEAHYDFVGVINTLPVSNCVIMDTGGGSCELILVQNGKATNLISLPVGAVNLTERFFKNGTDKIKAEDLFWETTFVNQLFNDVWWLRKGQNLPIVALGGSNRTLAKIKRKESDFRHFENIHGFRMSVASVNQVYAEVISKDLAGRKKIPGLTKERADIIAGGMTPIVTILRFLDSDRVVFSQNGVREGILLEHVAQLQEEGKIGQRS